MQRTIRLDSPYFSSYLALIDWTRDLVGNPVPIPELDHLIVAGIEQVRATKLGENDHEVYAAEVFVTVLPRTMAMSVS